MQIEPEMQPVALLALVLVIGAGFIVALWLAHKGAGLYDRMAPQREKNQESENG